MISGADRLVHDWRRLSDWTELRSIATDAEVMR
jgi:hypothetical protein